jgi:hypothetical protein
MNAKYLYGVIFVMIQVHAQSVGELSEVLHQLSIDLHRIYSICSGKNLTGGASRRTKHKNNVQLGYHQLA